MAKRITRNSQAKLTELQVLQIRALSKLGLNSTDLQALFKVSDTAITKIINRYTWTHVK